jgi:hypothetical protein
MSAAALTDEQIADLVVEARTLTRLQGQALQDFVETAGHSPALARAQLALYAGQDWTDPATPVGQRILELIDAFGAVGSAVGNIASAVTGVKAAV